MLADEKYRGQTLKSDLRNDFYATGEALIAQLTERLGAMLALSLLLAQSEHTDALSRCLLSKSKADIAQTSENVRLRAQRGHYRARRPSLCCGNGVAESYLSKP